MFRIGNGYDVHELKENRELILGGVIIPFERGLLGHSDADVLVHAIMDAILGALAIGDIGQLFPDTDMKYKDISSLRLLGMVASHMERAGYCVVNVDSVICCQRPRLALYIPKMRQNIADVLDVAESQVSVKATTTEGLGFVGEEKGMESYAVVLLQKKED